MKTIFSLACTLLIAGNAFSQVNFARIDSVAASFADKYEVPAELARQLTLPFDNELEKARVIFMWIAQHIRYDVDKYHNPKPRPQATGNTTAELQENAIELHEKAIQKTLRGKIGICQDYSELYKAMCDAVGLECVLVTGDARDFFKPYRNIHDNPHAWNAVKIDGQWHLLDATWGAGYVNHDKFTRKVATGFFMTPPTWFAQNHLPDKVEWQLLETPLDKRDFPDQPMHNYGQIDYPLLDFSRELERTADGKVQLRFQFQEAPKAFMVTAGKNAKLVLFSQSMEDGWVVLSFSSKGMSEVVVFMGKSPRSQMNWLARYDIR